MVRDIIENNDSKRKEGIVFYDKQTYCNSGTP